LKPTKGGRVGAEEPLLEPTPVLGDDAPFMRLPLLALTVLLQAIRALSRSRSNLILENLALRQQIAALQRRRRRARLAPVDRAFWVALRHVWNGWADALIFVKPETVVSWHRQAFRRYWRSISRPVGRPGIEVEIRQLIIRMASENPTWRAPRIHGELLKLGFVVSERTVSRYLPRRPDRPHAAGEWRTFLRNHREVLAAMDFFTVPTAAFRILYVWFVIHHDRRKILHFDVTDHPTAPWVIQQLREAFPYDTVPSYLVFDGDSIFAEKVVTAVRALGRELLDRVIVLHAGHLRRLLREYVTYYSRDRCHLGLEKDAPDTRSVERRPSRRGRVVSLPRAGGLHRRYAWRDAA
jgi:hypothetical protein